MTSRTFAPFLLLCAVALAPAADLPTKAEVAELIEQSEQWFLAQQEPDGSFIEFEQFKLGATLVALDGLTRGETGLAADHQAVAAALDFVDGFIQEDGSVQQGGYANYTTSLALLVWTRTGHQDEATIQAAQNYLIGLQNTDEDDINYGGIGYGSSGPKHEDLNNTTYAIQALRESGIPEDHPAMQRALKFVERCQNLSEVNDMGWAGNGGADNRGGGVYSPEVSKAGGSWSEEQQAQAAVAEARSTNTLRSYGSMSYSLITSYIYLDVDPEDPRIQAALDWCARHYQFDVNPGMPEEQELQGLFYYYQIMSKTFGELGVTEVPGTEGKDWRAGLFDALEDQAIESDAGGVFWLNSADRWAEGVPQIVSGYVLGALHRIHDSL